MDNKGVTRICGQCHKEVAEANFALHETHCSRFLCLCPECDEAIPKDQLSQHIEEQHTLVRCTKCYKKIEQRHLLEHESEECIERLQSCPFCELEVPWKDLNEHILVCGSRTELCRDCSRYVKLVDRADHSSTCSASDRSSSSPPDTSGAPHTTTVNCRGCMASFPAEAIDQHKMECFPAARRDYEKVEPNEEESEDDSDSSGEEDSPQRWRSYNATTLTHTPNHSFLFNGGDPDLISTCPHCHLALPVLTLRWHEVKCQIHIFLKNV